MARTNRLLAYLADWAYDIGDASALGLQLEAFGENPTYDR